ncbi:oxidoreductase [bacterium]|nr:oxidoreductase [bacterium]
MSVISFFPHEHLILVAALVLVLTVVGCGQAKVEKKTEQEQEKDTLHRFMVIDPGHFHASLVFKRSSYEGISPLVGIYAPVGEDFVDHMSRVTPFNTRADDPAQWRYHVYLGQDYREAMFRERFGDIAILSGKNDEKINTIKACIDSGFNVLADKPWIIEPEKFAVLDAVLAEAEQKGLVAYDIMTERFEITSVMQRLLVNHEQVFGTVTAGTSDDPAVVKSSVHHLSKVVAGKQLKRPWWFFDTSVQGEGLVDITTHLVDIVFWTLYPDKPIDYKTDIEVVSAKHWPTVLTPTQYGTITANPQFPSQFKLDDKGNYPYYCNGQANFTLKGVNVRVEVVWNYEAPPGSGDTHFSVIKGTRAHVIIRQGKEQNFLPEVYVEPAPGTDRTALGEALKAYITTLARDTYPGVSVVEEKNRWRIDIPQKYRVGHEAHFGQVTDRFLEFLGGTPQPAWERANMLAKYYVTTKALEMCRK